MKHELNGGDPPPASSGVNRRGHQRHRFIRRLYILQKGGIFHDATTFEISDGGLSVATTALLEVGEDVQLSFVVGERVMAVVRRKQGTMYGFEFIGMSEKTRMKIHDLCEGLPLFQTLVDI
jgi:PilZ domain